MTTLLFILCAHIVLAQEAAKVNGKVTDIYNNPVPFASVYIPELKKGGAADEYGFFTITNIPYGQWQLTASAVGYMSSTVAINPNDSILNGIRFQLAPDNELDQVEVFGNRNDHPDKIES
ncbi:MAG TPA: carboxypeptidase-like regulatory domain-containing protein, partial [Aequorivita sp.]|nr:carboxypeptidase-like regulatory domain-containing protein [Aequorivita sp.]